jgi:hypothetical protein
MVALTIAHGMVAKPARTPSIAESVGPAPADNEAAEPAVAAEPRLTRSVFLYLEPREGIDGKDYFGLCGSCRNFVPEAMMRGAVRGNRCAILGSNMPITDDSFCRVYIPTNDGQACDDCQSHAAEEMIEGQRGAVNSWDVGYVQDDTGRCSDCRHFEIGENECAMFEALNEKLPAVFDLNCEVKPGAKCSLWTDEPPPMDEAENG